MPIYGTDTNKDFVICDTVRFDVRVVLMIQTAGHHTGYPHRSSHVSRWRLNYHQLLTDLSPYLNRGAAVGMRFLREKSENVLEVSMLGVLCFFSSFQLLNSRGETVAFAAPCLKHLNLNVPWLKDLIKMAAAETLWYAIVLSNP